ncbi:MAG: ABC transporter permease, partial [Bacteroidia bacterium]|nr:ABC transporter permease [Bacteroidia bacterium]
MNHLGLVIRREYLTKVRNRAFIIMTILSPLILIALFAVVAYLSQLNNNKKRTISVLDETSMVREALQSTDNLTYVFLENMELEEAKTLVRTNENYGLLHIRAHDSIAQIAQGIKFYSEDSPSLTLITEIESKLERLLTDLRLQQEGVDLNKLKSSRTRIDIGQESFAGEKT